MMHRLFEEELDQIKRTILTMAGLVERALADATRALVERKPALARQVIDGDNAIDELEVEIDRLATEFIVRHQPAAAARSQRCLWSATRTPARAPS